MCYTKYLCHTWYLVGGMSQVRLSSSLSSLLFQFFFGLVFSFLGHTGVARVMCAGSPMFYESTHLPFCEHQQSYSMTEEFVPTSDVRLGRRLPQSTAVRVLHLLFPRVYLVSYDTSTCGHHYYARLCSDVDITWRFDCWPKCVSYHMRGKSSKTGW